MRKYFYWPQDRLEHDAAERADARVTEKHYRLVKQTRFLMWVYWYIVDPMPISMLRSRIRWWYIYRTDCDIVYKRPQNTVLEIVQRIALWFTCLSLWSFIGYIIDGL